MNRRTRAFTLLELIIVISIILVLMGMVLLGVRKISQSSRSNATKVVMETGRSMIGEYTRAATALPLPSQPIPQDWLPRSLNQDDWQQTSVPDANQLAADNTFPNGRYGRMVVYSRAVMFRMMQNPDVRKMIDAIPAEKILAPRADLTPAIGVYSGTGTMNMLQVLCRDAVTPLTDPPHYYLCSTTHDHAAGVTPPRDGNASQWYWLEVTNDSPALLDGFGNPLLFMPSCGFIIGGQAVTSAGTFTLATASPYYNSDHIIYSPDGHQYDLYKCTDTTGGGTTLMPGAAGAPWTRVATTPFFASAGPDGVFYDPTRPETLDDNVYSFEN